ncbi:MAG: ribonuclease E activity regulator RraA [Flavobacteriales bacterium]|nr:ribonuclease E activity regulator RraA [Flavobacteriales bacterium]MCB9192318.1 ribonuclease E activity regulator RraA [Flavobacteriales bacterium]MCB9203740.1 ribonuclease E activity regulator RraA [Flavobacteriales bacterium]
MQHATADLCDEHLDKLQVAEPIFRDFGGEACFEGEIHTIKVFEDNTLVRAALEKDGTGKVLVVDGGGSLRCALVGDNLVTLAINNNWRGIVVYGCIRDSKPIGEMKMGLKALNTNPTKSVKRNEGQENLPVRFAGVDFKPGQYLYADEDGIVVSEFPLILG